MNWSRLLTHSVAACSLLLASLALAEVREWTTADGGKTLNAEYVSSADGKVTIRRQRDRKEFTLPLEKISEVDREWVKQKLADEEDKLIRESENDFTKLLSGEWERTEGHGMKFRLFGERKLRRAKDEKFPLVIYLHGRGGNVMTPDQPGQARNFSNDDNYRKRPCVIMVPQCADEKFWTGGQATPVIEIIRDLVKHLPIDEDRIYLTGYSMGGYGTFTLLGMEPKLFAAGIPVAGGGNPSTAEKFKNVAVWVFHGAKDKIVPVDQSRKMVEALKKVRGNVKYTEDPEGNHGIGGRIYADKEIHEWMFAQKRE